METPWVFEGYQQHLPESVMHRIQQLHEKEARIVELEAELSQLRKDHTELERDLAPYRIDPPRAPLELCQVEAPPIHRCPDEILCLFFEEFLFVPHFVKPHYHHHIRRLLLVCRRWYTLVTNAARLWARIDASGLDLFDIGARKSLFPYIFACLNRSKNLPITVHLDMQGLDNGGYITESLTQHAKAIIDEDEHDLIVRQIMGQGWDFPSTWFDSQLESVIERLVGADGEHIKRWGTMMLSLPHDEDAAIRLWNILARGLKAVKHVDIKYFPSASPDIFMPDFGSVKNFGLDYVDNAERCPITRFGLLPSTLERLDIEVRNSSIDIAELSHFQQLRTLELCCVDNEYNLGQRFDFSISLPHLELLSLVGDYGILARLRLDFPSLYLLRLDVWGFDVPLPAIHPRHIQAPMTLKPSRIQLKKVIRDYILLSNALESITINHPLERDDVREVVAQSKLEGKASSLTQIIIEHKNGEVERIRV